ncbi:hypothetical protein SAMN05216228_10685 [Rhizobium tibeticum]|uniref:Uncharacterized protein n=1 Tax=Rhizobium tibeticum TaxID=501024 RepID=A0A1H8WKK0_9HYPH|nr:hypothetical protein [Rhizobium tibeticum]SEI21406.1 hypothetical protein RTCCBAU85039_6625 [Rhizobium tibeticum]SEP28224.1 hypothetical protein SAMN05216228_10685 [Rhizobium tibeticum]
MPIMEPVIHCRVDLEPNSFHRTRAFAVNLAFEAVGDRIGVKTSEVQGQAAFKRFCKGLEDVELHLFVASRNTAVALQHVGRVNTLPAVGGKGDPDLIKWLAAHETSGAYWVTPAHWNPDTAVDAETPRATYRLRAAQAWNAPVGHRVGLTYLVEQDIHGKHYVILPFSSQSEAVDFTHVYFKQRLGGTAEDIKRDAYDFTYVSGFGLGEITCRTNLIGEGITDPGLRLSDIDPGIRDDGYILVNHEADDVRHIVRMFEERSGSLLSVHGTLQPSKSNERGLFETYFGVRAEGDAPTNNAKDDRQYYWGAASWLVVARLLTALDMIVAAIMRPDSTSGAAVEGDVLAPLVSEILSGAEKLLPSQDGKTIAEALRLVLSQHSALTGSGSRALGSAAVVAALRRFYDIPAIGKEPNGTTIAPATMLEFISHMLDAYSNPDIGASDKIPDIAREFASTLGTTSVQTILVTLSGLEEDLAGEEGVERAIVRLLESVEDPGTSQPSLAFLLAATLEGKTAPNPDLVSAIAQAWSRYRSLLDGPFNGAEAVRRSAGACYARLLVRKLQAHSNQIASADLRDLVQTADVYHARLYGNSSGSYCFDEVLQVLATPNPRHLPVDFIGELRTRLSDLYRQAVGPVATVSRRFIPDSAPRPLTVQIASDLDATKIDAFGAALNGICVGIRRRERGRKWAHLNLSDLVWGPREAVQASGALHPMLPVSSDGRGAMFIDYEGIPFADAVTDERIATEDAPSRADQAKPFYRPQPHKANASDFEPLPRLAYGRKFQLFSFVTTNSGSLPEKIRLSADEPWLPARQVTAPIRSGSGAPLVNDVVSCVDYQRRTAIAQMGLKERAGHIGKVLPEVQPLADDYPRFGVVGTNSDAGTVDLMRDSDGMGRMFVANRVGNPSIWQLTDVRWSGVAAKLSINLYEADPATPDERGAIDIEVTDASLFQNAKTLSLVFDTTVGVNRALVRKVEVKADGKTIGEKPLTAGEKHFWVRIGLTGATADFASMTFGGFDELKPDGVSAPLLLLKPANTIWKSSIPSQTNATVSTPRVGFIDFSRWMANEDLRERAYDLSGRSDANFEKAKRFDFALLAAYNMRHLDEELARLLDNLPDPAVEEVEATLFVADSLTGRAGAAVRTRISLRECFSQVIASMDKIEEEARAIYNKGRGAGDQITAPDVVWTPWGLRQALFSRLDQRFTLKLEVGSGPFALDPSPATSGAAGDVDAYQHATLTAIVPNSAVSHFSLAALVPELHFQEQGAHPTAFHTGLLQYAKRITADRYYVYPAASLRIEVMHDGMGELTANDNAIGARLAADMISVRPVEKVRRYDLATASLTPKGDYERWRLLGAVRTTTQRWRPTGKPIYNYINPREHVWVEEGKDRPTTFKHPALRLELAGSRSMLAQFEREAFFDRSDVDAQTVPQLLSPLPASTVVQQFPWEPLSATYFRHRFTLHSRYIGALVERRRGICRAWRQEKENRPTPAHLWTMRVAMLADLSRIEITRPQLRALVPLTTSPGGEDALSSVPPVAAILQEPPFSRGGLADRILSEITTGFGYGFARPRRDNLPVEILDSRKEIGPNPQLTYRALPSDQALGLSLSSEGPAGLTFDTPDAPAPAFPNTLISLRPVSLTGDRPSLDQALVAVSMRRYIDPVWTNIDETGKERSTINLDPERSWWIGQRELTENVELSYRLAGGKDLMPLAVAKVSPSLVEISAFKEPIDGIAGALSQEVVIARAAANIVGSIAFLSCRIAPGRYSLSVVATRKGINVARGESSTPIVLASFEWSPEKIGGKDEAQPALEALVATVTTTGNLVAMETMASAATTLRWTQCSQDFNIVHILADGDSRPIATPQLARNLVAKIDPADGALQFNFANGKTAAQLCPSTTGNIYPVNVHRHLAVITSRFLKELGNPVETFCRTGLLTGVRSELLKPAKAVKPEIIDEAVRVLEFETPAVIVCNGKTSAPPAFKSPYFELLSSGYQSASEIRLSLRFVGSTVQLEKFREISVNLSQPAQPNRKEVVLQIQLEDAGRTATGATIVIRPSSARPLETWVTFSDGTHLERTAPGTLPLDFTTTAQGFFLSLDAAASDNSEFWADISMLHGSAAEAMAPAMTRTPAASFDFNWLFSATHGGHDPQAAVSSSGLNAMKEAQARLVTVSPPIPVIPA